MTEIIVRTKTELDAARKNKAELIIIEGDLAGRVRKSKKIAYAGTGTVAVISASVVASLATSPVTGGASLSFLAPVAALTGFEITAIAAVCFLGVGLIVALFKEYDEIEFDAKNMRLVLKRKQS